MSNWLYREVSKANMYYEETGKYGSPTLLVVNDEQKKLTANSLILASLNQVFVSISEASKIISWVQQYQPDLIVLDLELELSKIINLQLIMTLRIDWLTRKIPIMVITSAAQQLQFSEELDYDVWLIKPYSTIELEQAICSLLSTLG